MQHVEQRGRVKRLVGPVSDTIFISDTIFKGRDP